MSPAPVLDTLETDRLVLRHRRVGEAAIYRQLWTERDLRVPAHRRIDPEGRPTVEDIAAQVRAERENSGSGILAVERKGTADVIGYCGLIFPGNASPDEPELAYEPAIRTRVVNGARWWIRMRSLPSVALERVSSLKSTAPELSRISATVGPTGSRVRKVQSTTSSRATGKCAAIRRETREVSKQVVGWWQPRSAYRR